MVTFNTFVHYEKSKLFLGVHKTNLLVVWYFKRKSMEG